MPDGRPVSPDHPRDDDQEARELIAWLLWCINQGYTHAGDRAILHNWMGDDPATLHPDDVVTRDRLLVMADEVLAAAAPVLRAQGAAARRDAAEWEDPGDRPLEDEFDHDPHM